ncbi:flagellar hook protein FlgE [Cognatishimia activa]|uniref:Flagellar hook protein FlgE n=1 Tax=Cognatishimia activa TaxID=1715691 RepID=A0A975I8K7_9RHOB|nr:flagellar hook-basal body complex protein [Cognatishimia activa]QTN37167.1 flagellar hook-basal body complex protein [Cognatishimia activa]
MSLTSALQTGVSGLSANSTAVGGISENIANANTVGYKRSFSQMVTTTASQGSDKGVLSVIAQEVSTIYAAGGLIATNSNTDLAISGRGFFVVTEQPNETNQGNFLLTRAGSFLPDADGNLVNAAGYYLNGFPYDGDGNLLGVDRSSFASMEVVNVGTVTLAADATTTIDASGNVPSQETGLTTPGAPFITSSEYFTPLGAIERINISWQPTSTANVWAVTVSDHNSTTLGSFDMTFSDSGATAGAPSSYTNITSAAVAPAAFAMDASTGVVSLTLNNGATPQPLTMSFGAIGSFAGMTQFSGDFSQSYDRDGSNLGELVRTEFDDAGTIFGVFDNGTRRPLFEVPLGVVDNPNGLGERAGNAYQTTVDSGSFQALTPTGGRVGIINAGALEGSNVDIAQEMTDLIRFQRAFSTNASVVTTVDEMMEETTRLKR